jgi:hypothetical protein
MTRFGMAFFGDGSRFGDAEAPLSQSTSKNSRKAMASNELPRPLDRLFALGDKNLAGLTTHEVALDVKQNTHARLSPVLAAARAAETTYGDCKVARKTANAAVIDADNDAKVFISNARKRFAKFFGEAYSLEWEAAGWPNSSNAMPRTQDERYSLVESIRLHLVATPAHESVDMDVTAAIAATIRGALTTARGALTQKVTEQGQAKAVRDNQVAALRGRMSGLVKELATLMPGDDARWYAFGLSRPVDEDTPEAPTVMSLVSGGPNTALADWDDPLRADRYRLWIWIVGVDTEWRHVQTVYDSDATIADLPTGATVKARVTSANDAGESDPGPEAELVIL